MAKFRQYYHPTGRFDLDALLVVPLLLLPIWVVSFLYAGLLHWNPIKFLNVIVFAVFLFGLNMILVLAVSFSDNRSKGLAGFIALILAALAVYFSWANFLAITFDEAPLSLLNPSTFWLDFMKLYAEGSYTIFGVLNKGVLGAIIWLLEAAGILYLSYHASRGTVSTQVFCETCVKWVERIEPLYRFTYSNPSELVKKFEDQDLTLLDEAADATTEDTDVFSVDAASCNTCDNTHYMTLNHVRKDNEDLNEILVDNLKITRETFMAFFRRSGHWIPYQESGKYPMTVWLSVPLLTAAYLIGALAYQGLATAFSNYFVTLLLFVGFLFYLYWTSRRAIKAFATRNSVIGGFIGTLMGGVAVLLTNGALLWAGLKQFDILYFHPDVQWVFLEDYVASFELVGLGWLWVIIECLLIFLAPIIGAATVANSEVYCERCKEWTVEHDKLLEFVHGDPENVIYQFSKQETSFLKDGIPVKLGEGTNHFMRIGGTHCPKCQNFFTLSLSHIEHTITEDKTSTSSTSLIENMLATKHFWQAVQEAPLEGIVNEEENANS